MANEIVKPHDFELSIKEIHKIASDVPQSVKLESFQTEGTIIPWNDHNVTGEEVNRLLVDPLQKTLIAQNTSIINLFEISKNVYKALDSLDKEYIAGIIAAVESAKIASDQAKMASEEALKASSKASTAQNDIKRTIEALSQTVDVLKDFKQSVSRKLTDLAELNLRNIKDDISTLLEYRAQLEFLEHLEDVDAIWSDVESHKTDLAAIHQQVDEFKTKVDETVRNIKGDISTLLGYRAQLESLEHLEDVDAMWSDVESHKTDLAGIQQQVDEFKTKVDEIVRNIKGDISTLLEYRAQLESLEHLEDVDVMWSDVESHKTDLAGIHQQADEFKTKVDETVRNIKGDISTLLEYRAQLESCKHLVDVDVMWSDVESHKTDLAGIHQQVDEFKTKVDESVRSIKGDISTLLEYRAQLESCKHLEDVDAMWSDVESHKTDLAGIPQQVDEFKTKVDETVRSIKGDISTLQEYHAHLEEFEHLEDVDAMWSDVESHKTDLAGIHQQVDEFKTKVDETVQSIKGDISTLLEYRAQLESLEHLEDVDAIWTDVESHKTDLAKIHQQIENFINKTHNTEETLKQQIKKEIFKQNARNLQFDKKIKLAFGIAGGAVTLSLIQLLLILLGVL